MVQNDDPLLTLPGSRDIRHLPRMVELYPLGQASCLPAQDYQYLSADTGSRYICSSTPKCSPFGSELITRTTMVLIPTIYPTADPPPGAAVGNLLTASVSSSAA